METNAIDLSLFALPAESAPTHVVLLRGIPASGKSTFTKKHLEVYPSGAVVRINNDDLSSMLFGTSWGNGKGSAELLEKLRFDLLRNAIQNETVRLVFVDNTNLNTRTVKGLTKLALSMGANVTVDDRFLSVSVEECLRRDALRENPVGEKVIRDMAIRAKSLTSWVRPTDFYHEDSFIASLEKYENDESLPAVTIVDVDGTLALMQDRSPYAWHKVGEDLPNTVVVSFVKDLIANGHNVIIASGRDGVCRAETQAWLDEHVSPGIQLLMRTEKDPRPDTIVKHELFNENIKGKYHVRLVLDDRNSVVRLWRGLGLKCWQVAEGDF